MKLMKTKFLCGLALLALGVTSCKDNAVFDQNTYNQLVLNSFPVKNVDPAQSWTTVETATAEISVNLDYGVTYDVGLYLDNPINTASATRVYEKKITGSGTITTAFSYQSASPVLYVGIFDQQGRGMAQSVKIENGRAVADISTNIDASARHRASESASVYSRYVKTVNDYLNPKTILGSITCKQISEAEMKQYTPFTDADLTKNSTLTNGFGDSKHFRVASGTEITKVFQMSYDGIVYNTIVLYVEGKVHLKGNTLNGSTIVVANGGELIIDGNTEITSVGRFVVLAGGKITGKNGVSLKVTNGTPCYNAGSIDYKGVLNVNGCNFYNSADGNVKVSTLCNTSSGKITNFGLIEAVTNTGASDAYNCKIINGCHMTFTGDAGIGGITMLDNSRLDVTGQLFLTGRGLLDADNNNTLYNQSVINAGSIKFSNATIVGPKKNGEYGIVKTSKVLVDYANTLNSYYNVYWDINKNEFYDHNNNKLDITNVWGAAWHILNNGSWCTSGMSHFVTESTATNAFTIPAGKCTGAGYNDGGNSGGGKPDGKPLGFRFLFEDNYPDTGDYDFNDVVLKVTPEQDANNAKKVKVTVNLEATGASKNNGTAIRLKGVTAGMLSKYERTSAALPAPPSELGDYGNNIYDGDFTTSQDPNDKSSLVILLCKDVHWALNPNKGSNGAVQRFFYNTPLEGWTNYGRADVKTVTYEFTFNNESDAQKLLSQATYDAFIVEGYGGGFWEVHTVQNNNKGALVLHPEVHISTYQEYLNAYINDARTGNLPWAVMVPGTVAYPLEGRNIKTAYSDFEGWAQDHTTKTDWYLRPGDGHTFPLSNLYP